MDIQHLSGQIIGQYELRELIGHGGMGAVYRAWQINLEREVAFKVLPPEATKDSDLVQRFIREAKVIARLDEHEHIVPIFESNTQVLDDGTQVMYIVMRMLEESLTYRLRLGRLSLDEVISYTLILADALDFAHQQGIIHRDIKPSNVMFDKRGNLFLVDFGIAKISNAITQLTGSQYTIGTVEYMSPEQWGVEPVSPASDQWSLAVMVYQMLTGTRMPFEAPDTPRLMRKILNDPPVSILQYRGDLPTAVWDVLARGLNKEPSARYPSIEEFAQDLARTTEPETTKQNVATVIARKPKRSRFLPLAALLVLVVVIVIAVFAITRPPNLTDIEQTQTAVAIGQLTQEAQTVIALALTETAAANISLTPDIPTNTATSTSTRLPTNTPRPTATTPVRTEHDYIFPVTSRFLWTYVNMSATSVTNIWTIRFDPYIIYTGSLNLCLGNYSYVSVSIAVPRSAVGRIMEVFYILNNRDFDFGNDSFSVGLRSSDEVVTYYYPIDLITSNPSDRLTDIRLDPSEGSSTTIEEVEISDFRLISAEPNLTACIGVPTP